jgi:ATP-dependent protease ClpP protease subunit
MNVERLGPEAFAAPAIVLSGIMDYAMYGFFRQQLNVAAFEGPVVIELSTLGGDPEVARVMGEDVRFHSDANPSRRLVFLGKAVVYSAGTTFMSFFAKENRYLTRGTRLMIHERQITRTLQLTGPLTACMASVQAVINEIAASVEIQNEGFANLVRGSSICMDDVITRAATSWYLEANEACALGLVEQVL